MNASAKARETGTYLRGADGVLYVIAADGTRALRTEDDDQIELRSGPELPWREGPMDAASSTMAIVPDDADASAMAIVPDDADASAMAIVPDSVASSAMAIFPDDAG